MLPPFNSNQLQANGTTPTGNQRAISNPGSFCPNPLQIQQQIQMGLLNPGIAFPLANLNMGFAPNQIFPLPQGPIQNPNLNFFALNQMSNHNNSSQALGSFLAQNAVNPPQFLPNGQLNLLNSIQNVNQLLQLQMQMTGCGPVVPQNPNLLANGQSVLGNSNGVVQQPMNGNKGSHHMSPNNTNQLHLNSPLARTSACPEPGWKTNSFSPGSSKPQGNVAKFNEVNKNKNGRRKPHDKNFTRNPKFDAAQRGFPNPQFHHKQNMKSNFKFNNENPRKGHENVNVTLSDSNKKIQVGEKRRTLLVNYTEQEIQQWREERRKNHPSKTKSENKLKEDQTDKEYTHAVAKIRRQQLKEILAKQAELGCEVAEIPASYLSDSEQQANGRGENNKVFNKERFEHRFNKRGKFHQNDQFSKRQRQNNHFTERQSQNDATNKREPTLLQKLLSSDIRRDKRHLLQVFRFMLMNSFFQECPEKLLKFPLVIVREPGDESKIAQEEYAQILKSCNEDADDRGKNDTDVMAVNCR